MFRYLQVAGQIQPISSCLQKGPWVSQLRRLGRTRLHGHLSNTGALRVCSSSTSSTRSSAGLDPQGYHRGYLVSNQNRVEGMGEPCRGPSLLPPVFHLPALFSLLSVCDWQCKMLHHPAFPRSVNPQTQLRLLFNHPSYQQQAGALWTQVGLGALCLRAVSAWQPLRSQFSTGSQGLAQLLAFAWPGLFCSYNMLTPQAPVTDM